MPHTMIPSSVVPAEDSATSVPSGKLGAVTRKKHELDEILNKTLSTTTS